MKRMLLVLVVVALLVGCERKPEDLEVWRTAEGGYEKITEWAKSGEESLAVRARAVQILIEEQQISQLQPLFESITDAQVKKQLVEAAMKTVETLWATQDQPRMTDEIKEKGGQIAVGESKAVLAKDAAFFLHPHAEGATKERIEAILAEWMSEDQDLRTQLGSTTVGQLLPMSGEAGMKSMIKWLEETTKPATVQDNVFRHVEDQAIRGELAKVLVKRAEAAHPNVEGELEIALLKNDHPNIVPYLEKAIKDAAVPAKTKDGYMDAVVRAQGEKSTAFFSDMVSTQTGLLRWVAAQRLIEVRGKAGILVAANALPLDAQSYAGEDLQKESEIFCNFVSTEMKELGVTTISDVLTRGLESDRWPARLISLRCIEISKASDLKGAVEAMKADKTSLAWGGGTTTLGKLATEVAAGL
jgi:hypothetical protein